MKTARPVVYNLIRAVLPTYVALDHMILLCQWICSSLTSILKQIRCDSVLCNGTLFESRKESELLLWICATVRIRNYL